MIFGCWTLVAAFEAFWIALPAIRDGCFEASARWGSRLKELLCVGLSRPGPFVCLLLAHLGSAALKNLVAYALNP